MGALLMITITALKCSVDVDHDGELYRLLMASKEEVRQYKNKDSINIATIRSFDVTNASYLKEIEAKDETIKRLQKMVNRKSELLIIHDVVTQNTDSGSVRIVIDSSGRIDYPVNARLNNDWIAADVDIYEGKSDWGFHFYNSFEYEIEKRGLGFLGYNGIEYEIKAKSLNPYTSTINLRSLIVRQKPKRFHVGVYGGAGLGGLNIGVGVMYSVFSF